jgi:hypothetical protein
MKIQLVKANAFQIDPNKKYLLLITTPEVMTQKDIEDANTAIKKHFPNLTVFSFKPGTRFKVVEAAEASA